MSSEIVTGFLTAASEWIVDGGSLQVCFLASEIGATAAIIDASISIGPRRIERDTDFVVKAGKLVAGRRTFPSMLRAKALEILQNAISGRIHFDSFHAQLEGLDSHSAYSETVQRDRWSGELHLQLSGQAWPHGLLPVSWTPC